MGLSTLGLLWGLAILAELLGNVGRTAGVDNFHGIF